MSGQVTVSDAEVEGFSVQAEADFLASITSYKTDLLKEIGRIEAGQNAGSGVPEITSRMVKEAEVVFSRGSIFQRKQNGGRFLRVVAVLSLFIAGAMVQKESLKDFSYLLAFLFVVSVAIFTNILVHLRD